YPFRKSSPRDRIPLQDWVFAAVAAFCGAYLFLFYRELATRPGQPTQIDFVTAIVGMILLLEATRRVVGPPLAIIAGLMLVYAFAGPWMPDVIQHKGVSLSKAVSHYWLSTEGVFGVAAFLMAEYVGVSYAEICKNAALPAVISYIALFYIVHLEACKAGIKGLPPRAGTSPLGRLAGIVMTLAALVIFANVVYYG